MLRYKHHECSEYGIYDGNNRVAIMNRYKDGIRWFADGITSQPFRILKKCVDDYERYIANPNMTQWVVSCCMFCNGKVLIDPFKKCAVCNCGAHWFSRRAGDSDMVEEGWRKHGKEWVCI